MITSSFVISRSRCLYWRVSCHAHRVTVISSPYARRYIIWKLCASVIVLNIVLGIVVKSYFSAVGFALGTGGSRGVGGGVDQLMQEIDQNQVRGAGACIIDGAQRVLRSGPGSI
jgi:hypothetical protein